MALQATCARDPDCVKPKPAAPRVTNEGGQGRKQVVCMERQSPDRAAESESHYAQAYGCEESGELEKALRHYYAALRIAPSLADAHNLRAIVLEEMGGKDGSALSLQAIYRP